MSKWTKRERLLDWMKNGDPDDLPVLMSPGFDLAASYLKKEPAAITWPEAVRVAEETGTHNFANVHSPLPFNAVPFLSDIALKDVWDKRPDGTRRLTTIITTPEGELKAVQEFPRDTGSYHREFFVKGEKDLPAFACFIRKTTDEIVRNPAVRQKVAEEIADGMKLVNGAFPLVLWVFCPAVELTSCYYIDQETAIYALYDRQDLMEELMDLHWRTTEIWMEVGDAAGVDIYGYAINGYEWLNPDLYERYMVPQARRINEIAAAQGRLSWIHTCGKLKKIAQGKAYQRMKVNIVESLSSVPTGDIDDLAATRREIGPGIVTRGAINVEHFYSPDLAEVRRQTERAIAACAGFKHMLGDTNSSCPSYPWATIQTVIDTVRATGRLFE